MAIWGGDILSVAVCLLRRPTTNCTISITTSRRTAPSSPTVRHLHRWIHARVCSREPVRSQVKWFETRRFHPPRVSTQELRGSQNRGFARDPEWLRYSLSCGLTCLMSASIAGRNP